MSERNQSQDSWWKRFKNQCCQVVPDEIAACEFDCRSPECLDAVWKKCVKRLHPPRIFSMPIQLKS
jgi:hypothetical protein